MESRDTSSDAGDADSREAHIVSVRGDKYLVLHDPQSPQLTSTITCQPLRKAQSGWTDSD